VFVQELIKAGNLAVIAVASILAGVVIRAVAVVTVAVVAVAHIIVVTITNVAISIVIASVGAVIGVTISSAAIAAIVVASAGVISAVVPPSVVAIKITIASVSVAFVVIEAVFLPHEGIRILIQSLLDVRMLLQISLQRWMGLQELLIFYQRWIATKLFGGFAVTVKEAIELCQLSTATIVSTVCVSISVTVAVLADVIIPVVKTPRVITIRVFAAIIAPFLAHEGVWIAR